MSSTSQFKTWWFHWFKCPHCAYSSYAAYARGEVLQNPTRLLIRFRCKRCGQDSRLRHPYLNVIAGFALAFVLFVVSYRQALVADAWGTTLMLSALVGIVALTAFSCAITRFANKYVPLARAGDDGR